MNSDSKAGEDTQVPNSDVSRLEPTASGQNQTGQPSASPAASNGDESGGDAAAPTSTDSARSAPTLVVSGDGGAPSLGGGSDTPEPADDELSRHDSNGHPADGAAAVPSSAISTSTSSPPAVLIVLAGIAVMLVGITFELAWLSLIGALVTLALSWGLIWPSVQEILLQLSPQQRSLAIAIPAFLIGLYGLMRSTGISRAIATWGLSLRWDILGSLGDFLGAIGQIFVALLALLVAWRQYVISRDLTLQQNRITQQQTIDAYFQGISELVLDDEGLLEDWPQERIIAEARTAAILTSINASGKAKVIRFLSRSKLLTPLKRDEHLGRPILDGRGGYAEDRRKGVRVVNLGAILANADLSETDLRWTDLSDVNLIRANLSRCDLVRANFVRTILYKATLVEADLMGAEFFCGPLETASPRSRTEPPDFATGKYMGAVVEEADFTRAKRMSEAQRQYCCRWGGEKTRSTIPGGCEGIPNCLGR